MTTSGRGMLSIASLVELTLPVAISAEVDPLFETAARGADGAGGAGSPLRLESLVDAAWALGPVGVGV